MIASLPDGAPAPRYRRQDMAYIVVAALSALIISLKAPLTIWISSGFDEAKQAVSDWSYYNVSFLSANYLDAGFVRRGMAGTLSRLISENPYLGGFLFHVLSSVFLIVPLAILQQRLLVRQRKASALFMVVFIITSPQTFQGWADDIARTDMLVIGLIAWSVIAVMSDRLLVSVAFLVSGFLVHETAIIFGVPLVIAAGAIQLRRAGTGWRRPATAFAALAISLGLIVVVQSITAPTLEQFSRSMMRNTPPPIDQWHRDLRDCAIYMMVMGMRGLKTAICYNFFWQAYFVMVLLSLLLCAANGVALGLERAALWAALVIMAPVIFMDVVANDVGRWLKFACADAWILSAVLQLNGRITFTRRRLAVNYAILGILMYMGSSPVHVVNRAGTSIVRRLGMEPQPEVATWMTHCDPQWREAIGDAQPQAPSSQGPVAGTLP